MEGCLDKIEKNKIQAINEFIHKMKERPTKQNIELARKEYDVVSR
jgi:hypothetical protein